jgi:hypothetical protein
MIDQDSPHELCGKPYELRTTLPGHIPLIDKAQVGLVNQGRTLQRVVRALSSQLPVRKPAELCIDQRHQLAEGTLIASGPVKEELSDPAIGGFVHIVAQPADRATRNG